ncbi:tyrosine-type recombinase/integrase [uncultured Clostridium sp.]|uniref:tyrosine-type recombinase/integrase n=1 Tax=uncultured Clostridium sp. TaxID=59620 RepID=UPI0028EE3899|nr:tyrosine-type recombinase/integrase [uncultured Clostridium sp.]
MSDSKINELTKLIDKIGVDNLSKESLQLLIESLSNSDNNQNEVSDNSKSRKKAKRKKSNKAGMATRAIEPDEYKRIMELLHTGFYYENEKGKKSYFRPQPKVALALSLEATLGLRISDILNLKVSNFQKNKLELLEGKTNKLQYREIDPKITEYIKDYALAHKLGLNDYLIDFRPRWIQDRLQKISKYLGLTNVSTHSFRKYFATYVYSKSNGDIELVRGLLNHSSVLVTQGYFKTTQKKINEYSKSINFLVRDNDDE